MTLDFKGERINPLLVNDVTFANHIMRYQFAAEIIASSKRRPKSILDIACGAGYGTAFLAEKFHDIRIDGRDIDHDAIALATKLYSTERCKFSVEDLRDYEGAEKFDLVISFETLEHIDFPEVYFSSIYERLENGGTFILSVPDKRSNIDAGYQNSYHLNEMYLENLIELVASSFRGYKLYIQKQRKISKLRRIVGKLLSKYLPGIKSKILTSARKVILVSFDFHHLHQNHHRHKYQGGLKFQVNTFLSI